jgi:hypothetical protein
MNVDGYIHGDAATPCVEIIRIDSVECEPVNIRNFIKTQGFQVLPVQLPLSLHPGS